MLEHIQGIPCVLICLARQVCPHDLAMGGIDPGSPSSPDSTLPIRPHLHDLFMDGISNAVSWQESV